MSHRFHIPRQDPLTRERFRDFFAHCPECGIVRDNRNGHYLSEGDAQELEDLMSDCHPPIPMGDACHDCTTHETQRRGVLASSLGRHKETR